MIEIKQILDNINLEEIAKCYKREEFRFIVSPNCSSTVVVRNLVNLTQHLKSLQLNFIVDKTFNVEIIK